MRLPLIEKEDLAGKHQRLKTKIRAMVEHMEGGQLEKACKALEDKVAQLFPPMPQLPGDDRSGMEVESAYLI